jgi:IclR family transcriptional regulator, KDG regulon repressor
MLSTDTKVAAVGKSRTGSLQYVELVGKAIDVLEALSRSQSSLNLREISTKTGLSKTTAHRIVHSLARHGYVEQEHPGGPFHLGLQMLLAARGVPIGRKLVDVARPFSRQLLAAFNENTYIAVLHNGHAVVLDVQDARGELPLVGPLGADVHFHRSAVGNVLAAFAPAQAAAHILDNLNAKPLPKRALVRRADVEAEWKEVRRLGYAARKEDSASGTTVFAAPVFDASGAVCASLCVEVPKARGSEKLGSRIVKELKACCDNISRALKDSGYMHNKPW